MQQTGEARERSGDPEVGGDRPRAPAHRPSAARSCAQWTARSSSGATAAGA